MVQANGSKAWSDAFRHVALVNSIRSNAQNDEFAARYYVICCNAKYASKILGTHILSSGPTGVIDSPGAIGCCRCRRQSPGPLSTKVASG